MNQTSLMNTAAASGATVVIAPIVAWANTRLGLGMPDAVLASITAILITGAHWARTFANAWLASRAASQPVTQGATQ
jgi:hypothetical protein